MRQLCLAAAVLATACAPEVGSDPPRANPPSVTIEPSAPLDAVPAVVRITVAGHPAEEIALFTGELSEYHSGRLRRGDLPKTLVDRIVPAITYATPTGAVLAPARALTGLARYTLGALGVGTFAVIQVRPEGPPLLSRRWPMPDAAADTGLAVYCAYDPLVPDGFWEQVVLQPGSVRAEVRAGAGSSSVLPRHCLSLRFETQAEADLVPPPEIAGLVLDPSPLLLREQQSPPHLPCPADWQVLSVGCLQVQDDRVTYRSAYGPAAIALESPGVGAVVAVQPGEEATIKGFTPGSSAQLHVFEVATGVAQQESSLIVHMAAATAHPLLSEVYANAVGPEPQQEWIEIYNDGLAAWAMSGAVLQDAGGKIDLPQAELAPGAFSLIVNESYEPNSLTDLPPAAGTLLVRVPDLGTNGLSNAGEPLVLFDPAGGLLSRFPSLKHSKQGVSAARRPGTVSHAPGDFGLSSDPGASPGAPNLVEAP